MSSASSITSAEIFVTAQTLSTRQEGSNRGDAYLYERDGATGVFVSY